MQDNTNTVDDKNSVHPGTHGGRVLWEQGLAHQRNCHASAVTVKLYGLNKHYEWNRIAQATLVAMNVELGNYNVECSSANDPTAACTAFQSAAQTSAIC